jgi:hypothetical protein
MLFMLFQCYFSSAFLKQFNIGAKVEISWEFTIHGVKI